MKRLFKKISSDKRGTALLVALLVTGLFMAISLALSSLILRETRITQGVLDSGKAYYAAESGVEMALYGINNQLPGWEPQVGENGFKALGVNDEAVGEYRVKNRCQSYPCFDDEDFQTDSLDPERLRAYYDVLDLNESITIPLFVIQEREDGSLEEVKVGGFTVEFFAAFDPRRDLNVAINDLSQINSWDVLRWKVLGLNNENRTENISDFTAVTYVKNTITDEQFSTNAANPSWFGSVGCNDDADAERVTDAITCEPYAIRNEFRLNEPGQISPIIAGTCLNTEAREYYQYIGGEVNSENIQECYGIGNFLDEHKLNYLTLTNLVNPAVFKDGVDKDAVSRIFYRVELFEGDFVTGEAVPGNETVREVADIIANGYSGKSKQTINVNLSRGSFIPVFHFALYSTYQTQTSLEEGRYTEEAGL